MDFGSTPPVSDPSEVPGAGPSPVPVAPLSGAPVPSVDVSGPPVVSSCASSSAAGCWPSASSSPIAVLSPGITEFINEQTGLLRQQRNDGEGRLQPPDRSVT